jgi:hypothetical protein
VRRLLTFLLLAIASTSAASEPPATKSYFSGLRQRGLFDLAEGEALRRLNLAAGSHDERALLVSELARTFAEHAKYVEGREQADLWSRAEALVSDALKDNTTSGAAIELEVLRGELRFSQGATLRWLAELLPDQTDVSEKAIASLRSAVTVLTPLEQQIDRRLRDRMRGRTERTEPLSALELDELLTRVRLTLGRSELELARLAESKDLSPHVTAAERWLEPVTKGAMSDDPTWQAQVAMAEAARIAGQPETVRRRLAALDPSVLPERAKDEIAAVSTKLLIDENKPERAVAFLIDYRRTRGALTGELRLLQIAGLDAAASKLVSSGNAAEAAELRAQIPTVVHWTEAEHGGYWAYRARLAARRAERYARYGGDVIAKVRQAESAAQSGDFDAAAASYGEASKLAQSDVALASELESLRASMLLKGGRFQDAAETFLAISQKEIRPEKAAEAHLLSAYALGRFHDADPSAERRAAYVERLEEHRQRFQGSETAAEATMRLGRFYEQRRQYTQALPLYREVVQNAEYGPAAAAAIARCYENLLIFLRSAASKAKTREEATIREEQLSQWSKDALKELESLTARLRAVSAAEAPFSAHDAELALRTSGIVLKYGDSIALADELLDRIQASLHAPHLPEEEVFWEGVRRSSRPLAIVSLAGRGRYGDAEQLVKSLSSASIGDVFAVVQQLAELADPDGGRTRNVTFGAAIGEVGPRLSDLRHSAIEILESRRAELAPPELRQLDTILARADLAEGRSQDAADSFAAALADRPRDKALLRQAATMLGDSGDSLAIAQAREYWRRLETLENNGSDEWFTARLHVIETSLTLGDIDEARKLLTVTRLLHPGLGGGELKAAFDALQRRLGAETAGDRKSTSR